MRHLSETEFKANSTETERRKRRRRRRRERRREKEGGWPVPPHSSSSGLTEVNNRAALPFPVKATQPRLSRSVALVSCKLRPAHSLSNVLCAPPVAVTHHIICISADMVGKGEVVLLKSRQTERKSDGRGGDEKRRDEIKIERWRDGEMAREAA